MISEADILSALRGVRDPEMPINIVDLGLVEAIHLAEGTEARRHEGTKGGEQGTGNGEWGTGPNPQSEIPDPRSQIADRKSSVSNPPNPESTHVQVDVLPTFVGCPALDMIRDDIRDRLLDLPGVDHVTVRFLNDPLWTTDRISAAGRASLKQHGVTVPETSRASGATSRSKLVPLTVSRPDEPAPCPFCGSAETALESRFGPTRCRMIYYCPACRNTFEHLKRI